MAGLNRNSGILEPVHNASKGPVIHREKNAACLYSVPMHKPHKTLWSDLPCFCFVLLRKISLCLSLYYDCSKKYFTPEQFIDPGTSVSLFLRYFEHFTFLQRAVSSLR